jgi:hypothetical protein
MPGAETDNLGDCVQSESENSGQSRRELPVPKANMASATNEGPFASMTLRQMIGRSLKRKFSSSNNLRKSRGKNVDEKCLTMP